VVIGGVRGLYVDDAGQAMLGTNEIVECFQYQNIQSNVILQIYDGRESTAGSTNYRCAMIALLSNQTNVNAGVGQITFANTARPPNTNRMARILSQTGGNNVDSSLLNIRVYTITGDAGFDMSLTSDNVMDLNTAHINGSTNPSVGLAFNNYGRAMFDYTNTTSGIDSAIIYGGQLISMYRYSTNASYGAQLAFGRANGDSYYTSTPPSNGNRLGTIGFQGNTNVYGEYPSFVSKAFIYCDASENWNAKSNGCYLRFQVTTNGSSTSVLVMEMGQDRVIKLHNVGSGYTPGTPATAVYLWASNGEFYVKDSSGNATKLSPHNDSNDMVKDSYNSFTGVRETLNLTALGKWIQKNIPQEEANQIYQVTTNKPNEDWDIHESEIEKAIAEEILKWTPDSTLAKPLPYIKRSKPQWLLKELEKK
jgi:hypothetical protein